MKDLVKTGHCENVFVGVSCIAILLVGMAATFVINSFVPLVFAGTIVMVITKNYKFKW